MAERPRSGAVLHYPRRMDDVLYKAPRGKLHFSHCRDLEFKGSDFLSWEPVSAASVNPSDPRLCRWCRKDLLMRRAEVERTSRSPESLSEKRSPEDLLRLAQQAIDVSRQVIDLAQQVGPPAKRAMLATADSAGRARTQLKEWRTVRKARRTERRQREIKPADPPSSTYDADADSEEITDADVIDPTDGHSDGQPPCE
jgi:hypothetical protein